MKKNLKKFIFICILLCINPNILLAPEIISKFY
jgi:hypothetical protein